MFTKTTILAITLAALTAPMAFAKSHDQGINGEYHDPTKQTPVKETVQQTKEGAQSLGPLLRESKGFNNLR